MLVLHGWAFDLVFLSPYGMLGSTWVLTSAGWVGRRVNQDTWPGKLTPCSQPGQGPPFTGTASPQRCVDGLGEDGKP